MTGFTLGPGAPVLQPAYVRLMCEVVHRKGIDLDHALHAAGLESRKALQSREALVSVHQLSELISVARLAGFDDRLALNVGALLQVSAHGPLGYAAMASPDLHSALLAVARFATIRNRGMYFVYRSGPHNGVLEAHEQVDLGRARVFLMTCIAITIAHVAAAVHAGESALLEVELPFVRPVWAPALEAALQCRCTFGATCLRFRWSAQDLHTANPTSDAKAFGEALRMCEQHLSAQQSQSVAMHVRETLLAKENTWPELKEVAALLQMSARHLIRRLKHEGTSFQVLRDALRAQRAEFYLTQTQLTIEEIAHRLGYQDTSNFSRSCRRWFDVTPGELRAGSREKRALL